MSQVLLRGRRPCLLSPSLSCPVLPRAPERRGAGTAPWPLCHGGHTISEVLGPHATDFRPVVGHRLGRLDELVIHALAIAVDDGHAGGDALLALGAHSHHLTVQGQGSRQPGREARERGGSPSVGRPGQPPTPGHVGAAPALVPAEGLLFNQAHTALLQPQSASCYPGCLRAHGGFDVLRVNVVEPDVFPKGQRTAGMGSCAWQARAGCGPGTSSLFSCTAHSCDTWRP